MNDLSEIERTFESNEEVLQYFKLNYLDICLPTNIDNLYRVHEFLYQFNTYKKYNLDIHYCYTIDLLYRINRFKFYTQKFKIMDLKLLLSAYSKCSYLTFLLVAHKNIYLLIKSDSAYEITVFNITDESDDIIIYNSFKEENVKYFIQKILEINDNDKLSSINLHIKTFNKEFLLEKYQNLKLFPNYLLRFLYHQQIFNNRESFISSINTDPTNENTSGYIYPEKQNVPEVIEKQHVNLINILNSLETSLY